MASDVFVIEWAALNYIIRAVAFLRAPDGDDRAEFREYDEAGALLFEAIVYDFAEVGGPAYSDEAIEHYLSARAIPENAPDMLTRWAQALAASPFAARPPRDQVEQAIAWLYGGD